MNIFETTWLEEFISEAILRPSFFLYFIFSVLLRIHDYKTNLKLAGLLHLMISLENY